MEGCQRQDVRPSSRSRDSCMQRASPWTVMCLGSFGMGRAPLAPLTWNTSRDNDEEDVCWPAMQMVDSML